MLLRCGDIFYADLDYLDGVKESGLCPVIILCNQMGSRYSPTVICAVITKEKDVKLPIHIKIEDEKYPLDAEAVIKVDIIHTLDKKRLRDKLYRVNDEIMGKVDVALKIIFCLNETLFGT